VLTSEFIFETAPFRSCHASTIVEAKDGTLVAAWFGGTAEKNPDVGIWLSRREQNAWAPPAEVANGVEADGKRFPCWNPVLFQPAKGPLVLFYKVGPSPSRWWGVTRKSDDAGVSWSEPRRLPDGILGPVKNKPVELANGDWLCPTSTEMGGLDDRWLVRFERTTDGGKTWTSTQPVNDGSKLAAIQPSILKLGGEQLLAVGRTRQGKVFQISSDDAGKTWGPMTLGPLPNPNSGIDAVTLKDGRHLIVYNHTSKGRSPLNLAVSKDGREWQAALVLESEPGEYSYPAIIQTSDGKVHVTYTWQRKRIKHVVIDPAKLEGKAIVEGKWPDAADRSGRHFSLGPL
jgi:predicted neuraminidase